MARILLWKSSAFILKAAHNNRVFTYHLIETRAGEFTPGSDPCAERYDFCLLSTWATPTRVTAAGAWRKLPWTRGRMSRKRAWSLVLCFSSTSSSGQSELVFSPHTRGKVKKSDGYCVVLLQPPSSIWLWSSCSVSGFSGVRIERFWGWGSLTTLCESCFKDTSCCFCPWAPLALLLLPLSESLQQSHFTNIRITFLMMV